MDKFVTRSLPNPTPVGKRPREISASPDQSRNTKKFVANPKMVSNDKGMTTSNRFRGLPVDSDEVNSEPFIKATKKKATNNIPAFTIELNGDWTLQSTRNILIKYIKDFHLQYRGKKLVRVQCYSASDHQTLKDGLIHENIAFHTHPRKEEKRPKAVIKGLPKFLQDNLAAELDSLGFGDVVITELRTLHPTDCPPILAQLPSGINMTKFKQIKYLSNCVVEIERYKPSKKPGTQCFRCQGFGHAAKNCNMPPRCVKCALSHPTWECPKKGRDEPAVCCNCKENHPANYSKCDVRLKYLQRIETKKEALRKAITVTVPRTTSKNTWAQTTKLSNSTKEPSIKHNTAAVPVDINISPKPMNELRKSHPSTSHRTDMELPKEYRTLGSKGINIQDLDTMEMLEILTTIQSIKLEFTKCKTFMEKVILILTHLGHYV